MLHRRGHSGDMALRDGTCRRSDFREWASPPRQPARSSFSQFRPVTNRAAARSTVLTGPLGLFKPRSSAAAGLGHVQIATLKWIDWFTTDDTSKPTAVSRQESRSQPLPHRDDLREPADVRNQPLLNPRRFTLGMGDPPNRPGGLHAGLDLHQQPSHRLHATLTSRRNRLRMPRVPRNRQVSSRTQSPRSSREGDRPGRVSSAGR